MSWAIAGLWLGILCAALGGDLFVRSVVLIATWLRVPSALAAATLAAFATSSPEISVSINAGLQGTPQIALGDALGSNIVNVCLILGLLLCIAPVPVEWSRIRREFLWAMLVPVWIGILLVDGNFSRLDGLLSIGLFAFWVGSVVIAALRYRDPDMQSMTDWRLGIRGLVLAAVGLALLIAAGRLIVWGASEIGRALGMTEFLIGATIVAIGTSAPELATAVLAKLRGHDEIGVGTLLGSNIFNCLLVASLAGVITPFAESLRAVLPSLIFGIVGVALLWPGRSTHLNRYRGIGLLAVYVLSVLIVWRLQTGPGH